MAGFAVDGDARRADAPASPAQAAARREASDRALYQRQIEATDKEIDKLVYNLYGLTEEEIRIVEEEAR